MPKIILVTSPNAHDQADSLSKVGAKNRLISMAYMVGTREGFLTDYVKRGHGRYIDEDAAKIEKMSTGQFIESFILEYNILENEEVDGDD